MDQVNRGAVQQAVHILGLARIATQQAMPSKNPDVPWASKWLVRRLGNIVRVSLSWSYLPQGGAQVRQHLIQQRIIRFNFAEQLVEGLAVPFGQLGRPVVGNAQARGGHWGIL